MNSLLERISTELQVPLSMLNHAVRHARTRTRKIHIPKRNGGTRVVTQPAVAIKPVLTWLDINLLAHLPVHSIATAFRKNKSILTNAQSHKTSLYSVRIDIADFFPSIREEDLKLAMLKSESIIPSWGLTADTFDVLSRACFDRDGRLPIGYSTSPAIANATMHELDSRLAAGILDKSIFGNALLTRYADDFLFSSDLKGACNSFLQFITETLNSSEYPKLSVNEKKTRFMSRAGGSTLITGLRVNNQGNVVVHANYRDHVRLLLKLYSRKTLKQDDIPRLVGHLAYVEHVDPALYTRLSSTYYQEIARLRGRAFN